MKAQGTWSQSLLGPCSPASSHMPAQGVAGAAGRGGGAGSKSSWRLRFGNGQNRAYKEGKWPGSCHKGSRAPWKEGAENSEPRAHILPLSPGFFTGGLSTLAELSSTWEPQSPEMQLPGGGGGGVECSQEGRYIPVASQTWSTGSHGTIANCKFFSIWRRKHRDNLCCDSHWSSLSISNSTLGTYQLSWS